MFTGLIEQIGRVESVTKGRISSQLTIKADQIMEDIKVGDSVAVNGVCLTATRLTPTTFTADVMAETLRRSSLGCLKAGSQVNLERAMSANGRFGGHIVAGHIDGTGTILSARQEDNAVWITVRTPPELLRYIVEKGSVAIDGISLTVAAVDEEGFSVSIIPHTGGATTLLTKRAGEIVNLECDVLGKYIEKLLKPEPQTKRASNVDMSLLQRYGFL